MLNLTVMFHGHSLVCVFQINQIQNYLHSAFVEGNKEVYISHKGSVIVLVLIFGVFLCCHCSVTTQ